MSDTIFGIEADRIDDIVRKIKKESDNYAKMDVLEEFGVDWGDRVAALWELIRQGHYDAWNDPAIWSEIVGEIGMEQAGAEDLVEFLTRVEHFDEQQHEAAAEPADDGYYEDDGYYDDCHYDGGYVEPAYESPRLVTFWPEKLDVMAMHAYARDPELVESRMSECSPEVLKGLQLVRRRFGAIERDELPEDTVESLASTHMWNSLPWYVWDVVDGELTKVEIGRRDDEGVAAKKEFLSNFVDQQTWAGAVLDAIFEGDYAPSFQKTLEAWPVADLEQLEWMISNISIHNQNRVRAYELVLARDDEPSELLEMAQNLEADARVHQAEFAAICAVLRANALDQQAPEEALEFIGFKTVDSPTDRDGYHSLPQFIEALHAFDEQASVARFIAGFEGKYGQSEPFPALKAYPENGALLDKALQTVEVLAKGDNANFSSLNKVAFGLAMLGPGALEPIAKAFEATDEPAARNTYRRAILGILADADQAQDPKFDRFVSLADFEDDDSAPERDLGYYTAPDYRAALANMVEERAVARVLEDFDNDTLNWHRALAALETLPKAELFERAFELIGKNGVPPTDGYDWFRSVMQNLRDEIQPYLGPALAASDSPEFHNTVKSQMGEETYQRLLDEAGGATAADSGPADKIRRLSKQFFEAHPDVSSTIIYVFEKLDEAPEDTLNRVGGRPFGVTDETWPLKDGDADSPMQHLFTVDLDTVPAIRQPFKEEVRALSLFVQNPYNNKAWTPGNPDAEVVAVTRDDAVEFDGELPAGDESARGFAVHEVEVPLGAFTVAYDGDKDLRRVRGAIYGTNAWGGGQPMWLQGDDYFGVFVMQFDEGFVPMNLGDAGIMYVFADTAFWQCH